MSDDKYPYRVTVTINLPEGRTATKSIGYMSVDEVHRLAPDHFGLALEEMDKREAELRLSLKPGALEIHLYKQYFVNQEKQREDLSKIELAQWLPTAPVYCLTSDDAKEQS